MRRLAVASLMISVCAMPLQSAPLTKSAVPTTAELFQLGLIAQWHTYLPMDGARDGVVHAQLLGDQLVVQTRAGGVVVLDAETGKIQWQLNLGRPYLTPQEPACANETLIIIPSAVRLYGFERRRGSMEWEIQMPGVSNAPPAADDRFMFFCLPSGGVYNYYLPPARRGTILDAAEAKALITAAEAKPKAEKPATKPGEKPKPDEKPIVKQYVPPLSVTEQNYQSLREPKVAYTLNNASPYRVSPILTAQHAILADSKGVIIMVKRTARELADTFDAGPIIHPLSRANSMVYVGSENFKVRAFFVDGGRLQLQWERSLGSEINSQPIPNGPNLFVSAKRMGLFSLDAREFGDMDQERGKIQWSQPQAERFLAASPKLVMALDVKGRTLILDRFRGHVLGTWDTQTFSKPIANLVNDRLYLANHDGLLMCVRDRSPECVRPVPAVAPKRVPAAQAAQDRKDLK